METQDFTIRKATPKDADRIALVHVKSWQTSYAGIVDQSFLNDISFEKRLNSRKHILKSKNTCHWVILVDGQIVGFADAGPIRPEAYTAHNFFSSQRKPLGEIYAIYLLEQHKGKGGGKALFDKCRIWLSQKGFESFVIWILKNNRRARQFYESQQGEIIGKKTITIGNAEYEEICYFFNSSTPPVSLDFRKLSKKDIPSIVSAFSQIGWDKPASLYENYLKEQESKQRYVWVAYKENAFAGYVTLKQDSKYPFFKTSHIPEIADLNVLPEFRREGIATTLLDLAEAKAQKTSSRVGIGVGLFSDYGNAQRLYIKRGYIPDGHGVTYDGHQVVFGEKVCVNDAFILWLIKKLS